MTCEGSESEKEKSNAEETESDTESESGESIHPDTSYCSTDEEECEISDPEESYTWFEGEDKFESYNQVNCIANRDQEENDFHESLNNLFYPMEPENDAGQFLKVHALENTCKINPKVIDSSVEVDDSTSPNIDENSYVHQAFETFSNEAWGEGDLVTPYEETPADPEIKKLSRKERLLSLVSLDHLNEEEANCVRNLISTYSEQFYLEGDELKGTDVLSHKINLTDSIPVSCKQYKLPYSLQEEVDRQVKQMLDKGIIKKSKSAYKSNSWCVPKKMDNSKVKKWRVVVDYKELNSKMVPDVYPLPLIQNIFDSIGSAKYWSVLDLCQGFFQIPICPEDTHKTAFQTRFGLFEFIKLPFGLRNGPSEFQRLMDEVFKGLQGVIMFSYIDDIVIWSNTLDEHIEKFGLIMERLKKARLVLQVDKCKFLERKVSYLGHTLSEKGLEVDSKKIEAVQKFPTPRTVKNVREFIGLCCYYNKFIQNFAKIIKPLTRLLQKNVEFIWDESAKSAFNELKDRLCNPPILAFPNFNEKFIITVDASNIAIAGILSQGKIGSDRPIAYASRLLRGAEPRYETYEKEALSMIFSVKQFRHYVYNRPFLIVTDHKPLVWFKNADCNTRVQKWRFILSEYDYEIVHKAGKSNTNSDALSRNVEGMYSNVCVTTRAQEKRKNESLMQPNPEPDNQRIGDVPLRRSSRKKTKPPRLRELEETAKAPTKRKVKPKKKVEKRKQDKKKARDESGSSSNKENSEKSSSEEEDEVSEGKITTRVKLKNISFSKESLHFIKDHKICFVDPFGKALDEGSKLLFSKTKILNLNKYNVNEIHEITINRKRHFFLALANKESVVEKIKKLELLLIKLKDKLINKNLLTFSIAKSKDIGFIPWPDLLSLLGKIFNDTDIRVTVCNDSLIYLPVEERDKVFEQEHSSPQAGHKGVTKTWNRMRQKYFYENMKEDVRKRIQFCLNCQLKKLVRKRTRQEMIITPTPGETWERISLDICGPYPVTKFRNQYILTMQDHLSKYCIACPLPDTLATTVASAFINNCISIFGAPKSILTDCGSNFLSSLMQEVCKKFRIDKVKTTPYHPALNGGLERSHSVLNEFLKQYVDGEQEWDSWVQCAMFAYNTSVHVGTMFTPYEILFAKRARMPSDLLHCRGEQSNTYDEYLTNLSMRLLEIRKLAHDNLVRAKDISKKYYDRKVNIQEFKIGSFVFLESGPKPGKFECRYSGPYEVLDVLRNNNIKIKIKKKKKIVHSDRLRLSLIPPQRKK